MGKGSMEGGEPVGLAEACKRTFLRRVFVYSRARASRREYWLSMSVGLLAVVALVGVSVLLDPKGTVHWSVRDPADVSGLTVALRLMALAVLAWLGLAWQSASARRIRDSGLPGWLSALWLILPVAGHFVVELLCLRKSRRRKE